MRSTPGRNIKRFLILLVTLIGVWFIGVHPSLHNSRKHEVLVQNWLPRAVWDFVADINHLKITNPYLEEFEIVSDGGIYSDWHYTAILRENLPVLGRVESEAEYFVKTLDKDYSIITIYKHCRILLCVHVNSTLTFTSNDKAENPGTVITEELYMWFPNVLSWLFDTKSIAKAHLRRIEIIKLHLEKQAVKVP